MEQELVKVKIKRLTENSVIPFYAHEGDVGVDITATSRIYDKHGNVSYGTGLAIELPKGYVALLFPRSSICKKDLSLANAVGVVEHTYRGEIFFKFKPTLVCYGDEEEDTDSEVYDDVYIPESSQHYEIGDRIGQMVVIPHPKIVFEEVEELSETERGEGGFGSTDINYKGINVNDPTSSVTGPHFNDQFNE